MKKTLYIIGIFGLVVICVASIRAAYFFGQMDGYDYATRQIDNARHQLAMLSDRP